MVDIRVDPAVLVSDGDQLYSIANTLRSSISSAASQLRGTDGMAGSDPVAEEYAEIYDGDAPKIIDGAWSLVEALRGLDSAVAATALGYDAAGNVGIGQQGSTIPVPQHGSIGSAPTIGQAMGAGVQGDFLGIDIGMVAEWVEDALAAIGIIIPNGDTGALATAASAWKGLRDDLSTASSSVSGSFAAAQSMDLPQSGDMLASRDRIAELLTALSGNAGAMGEGCTGFIETIEQMRTELAWMVGQLVAEVLLDIGLSVALGFLTAGIGAAAGAAKAATTIARWVQRIAELIVETAQKIRRLKLWMRGLIRAAAEGLQGAVVSVTVQAAVNQLRAGDSNYEQVNLLQTGFASFAGGAAASPVGNLVAGRSGAVRREILGGVAEGATDGAASSAVDAMWEGKPWEPWQDMVLGGILGGALRPALSNLPSPSLGGSGSGNPSANAGTIGVPTVTGADTSGGTSTGPAGGNAPSTQSNAPQPGVGSGGGGGSQPAGGKGVNVPDNSAPQPGVGNGGGGGSQPAGGGAPPIDSSAPQPGAGDGGGSQPAPSNAPEVPSGDVPSPAGDAPAAPPADAPAAPPADAPAVPPADGPAAPPADGPAAPPADAPAAPPADAPAAPPADGPATPPAEAPAAPAADGPVADASTTDAPASDVPAADAPGSNAPASDAPPADGTISDAFGIPVVDLPNLPDALPSSAPSGPESPSSAGDASTTDASSDAPQAAGPLPASTPATVSPSQPAADADAPSASEAPSDAPDQDGAFPPASDAADAADAAPA